jgi:hypothetical protein
MGHQRGICSLVGVISISAEDIPVPVKGPSPPADRPYIEPSA